MCSTCWSVGIGIAFAVSITRSTSCCVTSRSLIATMPRELMLLMWLPAMPVKTSLILQSAISSASSSARWIALTVASMLTTTPFLRPLDGWPPMPIISNPPFGLTSATIAAIFDVPMSRPTISFLFSLALLINLSPLSSRRPRGPAAAPLGLRIELQFRDAHRETIRIAQVDVIQLALQWKYGALVDRDKTFEPRFDVFAPELHDETVVE